MISYGDFQIIDLTLFVVANLVNILLVGVFLSRPKGLKRVEHVLGIFLIVLAVPVVISVIVNIMGKREWWAIVLPSLLIVFLIVELILDYILKLDFRHTSLLWPYLLLYYVSLWGMIGYTFLIGTFYGGITLGTYFLNLLATWYSYSRVGHGE
ncbi:MAG: hypothetical protein AYK18_15750 [Theionarchaea archaeon DG-70]|nr:MAG: hypothetical protein AYK18_15750 [Theionarchaea archaeon DG-70]